MKRLILKTERKKLFKIEKRMMFWRHWIYNKNKTQNANTYYISAIQKKIIKEEIKKLRKKKFKSSSIISDKNEL